MREDKKKGKESSKALGRRKDLVNQGVSERRGMYKNTPWGAFGQGARRKGKGGKGRVSKKIPAVIYIRLVPAANE